MELPEEVKIFLVESVDNLDQVEQDLITLEKDPKNLELINSAFRAIHTIKGNSGFLGFQQLETVCHKGEAVLDRLRSHKINLSDDVSSSLLELIDTVRDLLGDIETAGKESPRDFNSLVTKLTKHLF